MTVERLTLPADAAALLAARAGVTLPPAWRRPHGSADRLVSAGLVGSDGEVAPHAREALAPLAAPTVALDLSLAPSRSTTALTFTALLVADDTRLVALLRRGGSDLVELTLGPATELPGAVLRLLRSVDGTAAGAPVVVPRQDVADALDDLGTTRTLTVTVVGQGAGQAVGLAMMHDTDEGWYAVRAQEPATVLLEPLLPADLAVGPLLAGAL